MHSSSVAAEDGWKIGRFPVQSLQSVLGHWTVGTSEVVDHLGQVVQVFQAGGMLPSGVRGAREQEQLHQLVQVDVGLSTSRLCRAHLRLSSSSVLGVGPGRPAWQSPACP